MGWLDIVQKKVLREGWVQGGLEAYSDAGHVMHSVARDGAVWIVIWNWELE